MRQGCVQLRLSGRGGCTMSDGRLSRAGWAVWWVLAFAPLVAACVALPFVPGSVPAGFGADGQVDRWGSKWELLVLPAVVAAFAAVMAVWVRRDRRDARSRAAVVMVGLAFLDVIAAWTIAMAFPQLREGLSLSGGSGGLAYPLLGIVLIVLGPILPRLSPNSLVGVRVPGCMDSVRWPLLQRFGGRVSVVGGFIELVACLFWLRGTAASYFTLALMAVTCMTVVAYGRWIARRD